VENYNRVDLDGLKRKWSKAANGRALKCRHLTDDETTTQSFPRTHDRFTSGAMTLMYNVRCPVAIGGIALQNSY
jgi:hypothetical protein